MITLTITLKDTQHQIVLAFKDDASAKNASLGQSQSANYTQTITDDYGQTASWQKCDEASIVKSDPELYWEFRNKMTIIRGEAENALNKELSQRPDLRFLVGGARADFGSK